jgi:hypothetical protein
MFMSTGQAVWAPGNSRASEKAHEAMPQQAFVQGDTVVVDVTVEFTDGMQSGRTRGRLAVRDGFIVSGHSYSPWPDPEIAEAASTSENTGTEARPGPDVVVPGAPACSRTLAAFARQVSHPTCQAKPVGARAGGQFDRSVGPTAMVRT